MDFKQRFSSFQNWAMNFELGQISFANWFGIGAAFAMLVFIWTLNWGLNIFGFILAIGLALLASVYGKTIGHLVQETIFPITGEGGLSGKTILWGWAGVITGVIAAFTTHAGALSYWYLMNFAIWCGVIWFGPTYPVKLFALDKVETDTETE